jgi:hypothetical protein
MKIMVEPIEHEALYSTIVGLTIYVDDLIVEIQIDGTDSNHWGIKFDMDGGFNLRELQVITASVTRFIHQVSGMVFEINNYQERVHVAKDTPEFCQ